VLGTVRAFNSHRGDGVIVGDNAVSYYFHCVEIANGTRNINVGERVSAATRVGLLGSDEMCDVQLFGALATRTKAS
jgi:cold shock CspA family protein